MNTAKQQIDFTALDNLKPGDALHGVLLAAIIYFGGSVFFAVIGVDGVVTSIVTIVPAIVIIVRTWLRAKAMRAGNQAAMHAFAAANGFIYEQMPIGVEEAGTIFTYGHSKHAKESFSGVFAGYPFTLFNYFYATGSGKSQRDYDALVMRFILPRKLPHMIIDSVVESNSGSTLPINFDKSQKIELEGDFHKYFDLYAPDKYGISALTVIAPDAMDALLRHAGLCDIEIIDDQLYFYWPLVPTNRAQYQETFATAQEVLKEIGHKLSHGDIFAHPTQAKVHAEASDSGVRLKKSTWPAAVFVAFVGFQILSLLFGTRIAPMLYAVLFAAIPLVFIFAIVEAYRRSKLREEMFSRYRPK